jgi:catechol 2,3-dioxygenase-like lactoylglutathione lyase family enzyme|tara:strand:+ start:1840 stop:2370 length:531 start_codon:yes stop_codon:yes gene_type:complete
MWASTHRKGEKAMIHGLHHNAYRCRDSEETRMFYEGFLGLPLVHAFEIVQTKTGRETRVLHSFYQMQDGSCLAFFEVPSSPFDFKDQHDFDLHIALLVDRQTLLKMFELGKAQGRETRGIADHGFIESIYFRDPNGYVIELTAPTQQAGAILSKGKQDARGVLSNWQATKPAAVSE